VSWRFDRPTPTASPADGECHLWPVPIRPDAMPEELSDPAERAQAQRFRHAGARATFVVSRLAQRTIMARYLGVPPEHVTIDRTCEVCGDPNHGRPAVDRDDIDYSVSHSGDWCLIAVGRARVGVDIERVGSLADVTPLLARTLNGSERVEFEAAPAAARTVSFYRAWARKEAAAKAVGLGLRADVSTIDVRGDRTAVGGVGLWLRDLDGPHAHAAALASATPITRLLICDLAAA
jgi:4'-phosphopantetheinyl transferase